MISSITHCLLPSEDHPFYVGLQAHPEFCTRPLNPSPPFLGFVAAASDASVLEEQILLQKDYISPHPDSARNFPSSFAAPDPAISNGKLVNGATH